MRRLHVALPVQAAQHGQAGASAACLPHTQGTAIVDVQFLLAWLVSSHLQVACARACCEQAVYSFQVNASSIRCRGCFSSRRSYGLHPCKALALLRPTLVRACSVLRGGKLKPLDPFAFSCVNARLVKLRSPRQLGKHPCQSAVCQCWDGCPCGEGLDIK